MKKIYLLMMLLLTTASTTLKAQELPCKSRHWNGQCKESYREDSNGKYHGKFISYNENGAVLVSGNYIHGKKQGNWRIAQIVLGEDAMISLVLKGFELSDYYYFWFEDGQNIAIDTSPINSVSAARAVNKRREDMRKKAIADAQAESQEEAEEVARKKEEKRLKEKIEDERLAIEEERLAKEAAVEAERVRKLRVRLYSSNVNIDDILEVSQGGATDISAKQIEEFKKFFEPDSKAEVFMLYLGNFRDKDYDIFRKVAFNYIAEKTTIDFKVLPENLYEPDKITIRKWNGKVRKVSLNDQIHAIKYKDGVTYFRTKNPDNNSWEYVASGNITTKITSYGASSEAELINATIAIIGSVDNRSRCINGTLLNNIIYRAELLEPEKKAEVMQFMLDVLLANGTSTICENGATENKGVLYRTYAAYLLWSLGDKEQSKRLFTKINLEKPPMDRRDKAGEIAGEWVTGSYADYLNKYFHRVFVDNSSNDDELYELTLSRDKELKKFLKSL